jgi:hypothetical protein
VLDVCAQVLGDDYIMVHSVSLQATHLVVYASRKIAPLIREVTSQQVALGYKGNLGNKGACAVKMTVGMTKLVFIACHLHSK